MKSSRISRGILVAAALLLLTLAGCSGNSGSTPAQGRVVAANAPKSISSLLADLETDYTQANWDGVRADSADSSTSNQLIASFKRWKANEVSGLRVSLVSLKRLDARRSVGTVEFSADPRAVPAYSILVFANIGGRARIEGTTTGLRGGTYRVANWSVTHTPHFTIYHSPYQLAGTDRRYLPLLEHERQQFEKKFGVSVAPLTSYYLYPTTALMGQMTRHTLSSCGSTPDNIGCATPYLQPPTIQASIWPTYHEPIHIFEVALSPPKRSKTIVYVAPLFIGEGTAVALENREVDPRLSDYCSDLTYIPLDDCARDSLSRAHPISLLSDHGFGAADSGDAYALAGDFVKYLIVHGGYRKFGHFYYTLAAQPKDRQSDYDVAARAVYHTSIAQLLKRWTDDLCPSGCS